MNKHRAGARIGHDVIIDPMMMDGLKDAYARGGSKGVARLGIGGGEAVAVAVELA